MSLGLELANSASRLQDCQRPFSKGEKGVLFDDVMSEHILSESYFRELEKKLSLCPTDVFVETSVNVSKIMLMMSLVYEFPNKWFLSITPWSHTRGIRRKLLCVSKPLRRV